eukprot:EG_transcript_1914
MCPRNAAPVAGTFLAGTSTASSPDADVPICLDFLKGRCSRAQCRFLHPDLAQYEQLSGAVLARAGRRVCEVWAMTGTCKFGAKCSRLHPSVVAGPQPQQVVTLMLPLAVGPQAALALPTVPARAPAAPPAAPQYPQPQPAVPPTGLWLGPVVTVRPPCPARTAPASWPVLMAPASPVPRTPGAPPPPAASVPALPTGGPRRPSQRPAAAPAVPLPARPQHVELPNPAEPPTVGIRELARAILESVGQVRGHFSSCPSKKGQPEVPHFAEEPSPCNHLLMQASQQGCP